MIAGSILVEVLGGAIGLSIIGLFLGIVYKLGNEGLFDFISDSFEPLGDLLGGTFTNILISVVILIFLIMFGRFVLSFLGENGGQSANS